MIYAEDKGDVLTAKVRATPELYNGYNKTYFHEFELQILGSPQKIHMFLTQVAQRKWSLQVSVNYKRVSSSLKLKNYELMFSNDRESVTIKTRKHSFTFKGISLSSKFRRHLYFNLKKGPILKSERYSGVLGMTLNRRLGSSIHEEVIGKDNENQFEMKMRRYYGLKTLFLYRSELLEHFSRDTAVDI